ncbi:General stress protein 20U [Lentibacillus sp. JNUCC-1]|uniref:Dps family protein n=1 Tax=Lentibacillus sp. JNUCC-1 TaxID=2654513 RepID=UPI0012E7A560|nr:DNA starvation/stationary phase protection protein [Lentibacillus sp. JNUCC-1]MUV39880.1 General stress protein 20U [Lentibacillus sp. JNUCC-1]
MEQQPLINFLNQLLSNQFVLYVKLHRYHWFIQGQHFFELHRLFESLYKETAQQLDDVAERILAIDGKPLATMAKFLEESTLVEASADDTETEIIHQLQTDYETLVHEIRETGLPLADKDGDEPSTDLLVSLQGIYEKHLWMLKAYQEEK